MMVSVIETETKEVYSPAQKFGAIILESKAVKKLVDALELGIKK